MVNESRQVLQEPDFAQLLLRDPNTPVVRKSRGTSTQGTSTHASSTHLAMLDEPPSGSSSRAGSLRSSRSKASSYQGSLHRSRDGRWGCPCFWVFRSAADLLLFLHLLPLPLLLRRHTASSFRATDERLAYGSLPRMDRSQHCSTARLDSLSHLSRHGSTQRLESQSRHSSTRDLSTTQTVLCVPGNGIHRVLEEDGGTA